MEMKQLATVDKVDARRPKRLKQWQEKFIAALREAPHVGLACKAANISREMAYRDRRDNPTFEKQWSAALEDAISDCEVVAFREAMRGNTQLLIFLLKCHKPTVYSRPEQHQHALLGKVVFMLPEKETREP
jgi:hypothetical protein